MLPYLAWLRDPALRTLKGWWLLFTGSSVAYWTEAPRKAGNYFHSEGPATSDLGVVICFDWEDVPPRQPHLTQTVIFRQAKPRSKFANIQRRFLQTAKLWDVASWKAFRERWQHELNSSDGEQRSSAPLSLCDVWFFPTA